MFMNDSSTKYDYLKFLIMSDLQIKSLYPDLKA